MILSFILSCALALTAFQPPRIPCVLIEFRDVHFDDENVKPYFKALLNNDNYSEGQITGSVRDYMYDNSMGIFTPVFDVLGPVRLDKVRAFYGHDEISQSVRTDYGADIALAEACRQLDSKVDFSIYDSDEDGAVDMILFIFAGHDQAQGAPSDAIWSHQWFLSKSSRPDIINVVLDGVRLDAYLCTSQYRGSEGKNNAGIGLVAHELGHAMGLPDFYDTLPDGVESMNLSVFSLMCYGFSNNDGFTPPYLNAEERIMLGWMDRESLIPLEEGPVVLEPIQNNKAYIIPTDNDGEYFVLEYRNSQGWDATLPEGLAVYHVDRSAKYAARWENWREPGRGVNDNAQHPCFYLVQSCCNSTETGSMVFPGFCGRLTLEPCAWDGKKLPYQLTNIAVTAEGLSMYVQYDRGRNINGYVKDTNGNPIPQADITIFDKTTRCMADGYFMVGIPEEETGDITMTVSAPSFMSFTTTVNLDNEDVVSVPVTLWREGQPVESMLSKYDESLSRGYYSKPGIGAVKFNTSDLAPYVGGLLKEITFYPYLLSSFSGDVYVTVDIGTERVLTRKLEMPNYGLYFPNTVNVEDADIVIPEGLEMYVGYGSPDSSGAFYTGTVYPGAEENSYWSPFNPDRSSWEPMFVEKAGITMNLSLKTVVSEKVWATDLSELGYAFIKPGRGVWLDGEEFELELIYPENSPIPATVKWYFDGVHVRSSVTLTSGYHVLIAELEYSSGMIETIRKEFNVR